MFLFKIKKYDTDEFDRSVSIYSIRKLQRVCVSIAVLYFISLFALIVIIFRAHYLYQVRADISMLLSTLIVFIASTEAKIKDRIDSPTTYLMAAVIFKILKGVATILIFSMNGSSNDFYVAWFFFCSSVNGIIYLEICGYHMPKVDEHSSPI